MYKISKASVKKLVREKAGISLSDAAAASIAKMLEEKAERIARYAVRRAKASKRSTVTGEDIDTYRLKYGD